MASFWGFGNELFLFLFLLQGLGYLLLAPLSFPPSGKRATFSKCRRDLSTNRTYSDLVAPFPLPFYSYIVSPLPFHPFAANGLS